MRATTLVAGGMPLARLLPAAAVAVVLALSAGCGASDPDPAPGAGPGTGVGGSPPPTVLRAATLLPGQAVPMPAGKPLLTVTGKVSAPNREQTIVLDRKVIEQLSLVKVRVYEPWIKQDAEFRGVWLQDLLAVAGAAADASGVRITALDDYTVDLTAADLRAGGILLATSAGDGSELPVEKGGPTRIIFVDGAKAGANADQWIWSLKSIDVR
jgi:hypothetical protein